MKTLRPYQSAACDALWAYFERGAPGNTIVCAPTASGKTIIIAEFCRRALAEYPETRILIVTHTKELIEQDAHALQEAGIDCGMYSAGLGVKQIRQVTVGGIQSLHTKDMPHTDLCLVDEVHRIPHVDDGMYRDLLRAMTDKNPNMRIAGFTATPYRTSGGMLTKGKGKLFDSICFDISIQSLVDDRYICPLVSPSVSTSMDVKNVKSRGGDYVISELAAAVDTDPLTEAALNEFEALASDRKSVMFFCVTVAHAENVIRHLRIRGHHADIVTGETDAMKRRSVIEAFKARELRCLVSVDALLVGFDAPATDCLVFLRPTESVGLYVQAAGRGCRLYPGKTDCLILDFAGLIARHGPITHVNPKAGKKEPAALGIKDCPKCMAEVPTWKKICPECGFIFPVVPREISHDEKAARLNIMGPPPEPVWIDVVQVTYEEWRKKPVEGQPPSPPTVRVKYLTGNLARRDYSAWWCPEHGGFAREKFCKAWRAQEGRQPYPTTVAEVLERYAELRDVEAIVVEPDGKYTRIVKQRLAPMREPGQDDEEDQETEMQYSEPPSDDLDELPF